MSNNAQQQMPRVSQEYVDKLIQKLQPPPGMSKQQRLQQLLAAGQLTRQDIAILKAHQARRNAALAHQKAMNAAATANVPVNPLSANNPSARNVPGKTVPGKTIPSHNIVNSGGGVNTSHNSNPLPSVTQINTKYAESPNSSMASSTGISPRVNIRASVDSSTQVNKVQHLTPQQQQQQQQFQQQQQLKAYQQKMAQSTLGSMTKEQWDKLTPQQKQMYRYKQIRNQARVHKFAEGDDDILKKYENEAPSLEFHIHNDYYRMGNSDSIISKSNPAIKDFLKYVAKGKLPDSLMEIIKDGGIKLYDGNVILQIFDHRINDNDKSNAPSTSANNGIKVEAGSNVTGNDNNNNGEENKDGQNDITNSTINSRAAVEPPKEYRTLLRMTQAAMYEDFSVSVDMKPVPDSFFLTYESEILATMNRSLNLQPILNPYLQDKSIWPENEMFKPEVGTDKCSIKWPHRADIRGESLTPSNYKYKPLHQDISQSKTTYEKLMLMYSQSSQHSNLPAGMSRISFVNPAMGEAPRFERFRFIENYRIHQKQKRDNIRRGLQGNQNGTPTNTSMSPYGSMMSNGGQVPTQNASFTNLAIKNESMIANSSMVMDSKQVKKPKKPTKRQLAVDSPINFDEPLNKKRVTNKKR